MDEVPVKIKIIGGGNPPVPSYMSPGAAGVDLQACLSGKLTLQPGERALVPTGLAVSLPPGYEAQIRPRSGLAAGNGVTLVNSPGTIDSDYRGEIKIILINHGDEAFLVGNGDRVAQMVVCRVARARFDVVDELDGTDRGSGGFGHTGV